MKVKWAKRGNMVGDRKILTFVGKRNSFNSCCMKISVNTSDDSKGRIRQFYKERRGSFGHFLEGKLCKGWKQIANHLSTIGPAVSTKVNDLMVLIFRPTDSSMKTKGRENAIMCLKLILLKSFIIVTQFHTTRTALWKD